jgi:hypothetical protein
MKTIILLFLIGLSFTYDPAAAVKYAKKYWQNYNPNYANYKNDGGDCANFVSQCMIAGGFSFKSCSVSWRDGHGCLPRVRDLKSCLEQKGWHHSTTKPAKFKAGYPLFKTSGSHAMLATKVEGNNVYFAAHTTNYYDHKLTYSVDYYYP